MEGLQGQKVLPEETGGLLVKTPLDTAAMVQQAHGITTNQGDVVLAGGSVNIYHGYLSPSTGLDILSALRLVRNLRRIHLDILSRATPGTGVWFLKTDKYLIWLDLHGNVKILWGTGIPGAGKTVMASIVIHDLEARATVAGANICIAYVYFRYSDAADLTVRGVLEILVKQTVERHPNCALLAEQAYARHLCERTQPTEAELLQLLDRFTEVTMTTFYVLDALDEAPEKLQVSLVKKLASLNVRLFITSRPLKVVEAQFSDVSSFHIVAQDGDLGLHISQEIENSPALQALLEEAEPDFKDEMISSIKKNCGGMFLHASLQLEAIGWCDSTQDVMDALEEFPSEIEYVYHQTWKRICNQPPKNVALAKAILIWVLNASRSMTIEELRHAIATSPTTHEFERKRLVPGSTIITRCCGLVVVEEETKLVRLVHYTAKDTLQQLLRETFPHPHSLLATVCMTHLMECGFQITTITSEREYVCALQADPLLAYATDTWATHARDSLDVVEIKQQTAEFVSMITAFPSFLVPGRYQYFDILGRLHILALYDLPLNLMASTALGDPNIKTRAKKASPLLLASYCGNINIVQGLLCLAKTQINLIDRDGWSALMYAAHQGHEDIVTLLLAHSEVQVNLADSEGWPALMKAASQGHEGIVVLLLARPEIQVNSRDNEGRSALVKAASRGHTSIIQLLLARPEIEVNSLDKKGWSALSKAASRGHKAIVHLLISRLEIEVNSVNSKGHSALMFASYLGYTDIVSLLLSHPGIRVNLTDSEGCSALMFATRLGKEDIVKLLLAHPKIQVDLVDNRGRSPLMNAAYLGHEGILRLLLAHPEVQVDWADSQGRTALMLAANQGHPSIIRALQDRNVLVNSVDNEGWSALMYASLQGHTGAVVALLERSDARINLAENKGWSALMVSASRGHQGVVEILLGCPNILVNMINQEGRSALMYASQFGHQDTVLLLLTHPGIHDNRDPWLLELEQLFSEACCVSTEATTFGDTL